MKKQVESQESQQDHAKRLQCQNKTGVSRTGSPVFGDSEIICLVVGRLLRGSRSIPSSWSNSHILVNVCSALLL